LVDEKKEPDGKKGNNLANIIENIITKENPWCFILI
jgi:hypothetical protein